jgi:DUF4097 and DUF4098 domain-containing protein YvlB
MTERRRWRWLSLAVAGSLLLGVAAPGKAGTGKRQHHGGRGTSIEKTCTAATRPGLRLHLVTDIGSVKIRTQNTSQVETRVHIETDSNDSEAQRFREQFAIGCHNGSDGVTVRGQSPRHDFHGDVWVRFDVTAPANYSFDVSTDAGNIEMGDAKGRVTFSTEGGNLSTGNVIGTVRLQTAGGHITVKDVSSELNAETGGGHITAGRIGGGAVLHTGGGHIRVATVGGTARLETGGGNISLERSGGELTVETGGGQIQVGEASSGVRARTGGGGIRVVRVTGPTELETGAGSIYLTKVESGVRASTGAGGITAWFDSGAKLKPCQFESGEGDINVYIPKDLRVTIDALIHMGDEHRIIVDPAFPLKVSYENGSGARTVRAEGPLNGGGERLRLSTTAGNIRLILMDVTRELQLYKQQMEQLQQQMQLHKEKSDEPEKPDKDDDQ